MVRKIRIISQAVFFTVFIFLLYVVNRPGAAQQFPSELLLQVNPLVALLASIASRAVVPVLLPAAIVMVATVFFGRFFCGFVCPLGAAIDFSDTFITGKMRRSSRRPPRYLRSLKYSLLAVVAVLGVFGVLLPLFLDPVSISTRFTVLVVNPILRIVGHETSTAYRFGASLLSRKEYSVPEMIPGLMSSAGAVVLFAVVFGSGLWDRRFWCQYICPSGAFFGLLSRFSFFRRRMVTEKCCSCGVCAKRHCPTRAIDEKNPEKTSYAECILCGKCADNPKACSEVGVYRRSGSELVGPDLSRRHAVSGVLGAVVLLSVAKYIPVSSSGNELIRPPGALPEAMFLSRCLACGECMKVCPQHALHPCGLSSGFGRLGTPRLIARFGYCDPECNACTYVCPTVALRPVSAEDKPFVKIGTAAVDLGRCLSWRGERRCGKCISECPYQAVTEEEWGSEDGGRSGPVVDKKLCTGCGACEYICPVSDIPAIQVQSYGENRVADGAYISENRRKNIIKQRKKRIEEASEEG